MEEAAVGDVSNMGLILGLAGGAAQALLLRPGAVRGRAASDRTGC